MPMQCRLGANTIASFGGRVSSSPLAPDDSAKGMRAVLRGEEPECAAGNVRSLRLLLTSRPVDDENAETFRYLVVRGPARVAACRQSGARCRLDRALKDAAEATNHDTGRGCCCTPPQRRTAAGVVRSYERANCRRWTPLHGLDRELLPSARRQQLVGVFNGVRRLVVRKRNGR
jgi:hypothetical protein